MPITDRNVDQGADFAQHQIVLGARDIPISQSDVLMDSFLPGFPFEIVAVQHFADAITAAATYMVKVVAVDALAAETAPTAVTRGDATLHATVANRRGGATDPINLHMTSDGTGVMTDLKVRVVFQRQPQRFTQND